MAVLYLLYETTDRSFEHMINPTLHQLIESDLYDFELPDRYHSGYTHLALDMLKDLNDLISDKYSKFKDLLSDLQARIEENQITHLCVL